MSPVADVAEVPTPASVWQGAAGREINDELVEWPPDMFALTEILLERSEVYRFALSPPNGLTWPPERCPLWPAAVAEASHQWSGWVQGEAESIPDMLTEEWEVFREGAAMPLADRTEARDWRMCEALLTLHAIADEACAGLGVPLTASAGIGCVYRARGRELLARTGSLSRIPPHRFRVLPKVRTSASGSSIRPLSRGDAVLVTIRDGQPGEQRVDRIARRVLRYALEQRITRQANQAPRHGISALMRACGD